MDAGITDTCFYMEANAGDGGNHNPNMFWMSPDIKLNGTTYTATPGQPNTIEVHIHEKATAPGCPDGDQLLVDIFVANPSVAMIPPEPGGVNFNCSTSQLTNNPTPVLKALIGDFMPDTPGVNTAIKTFSWTPPQSPPPPAGCPVSPSGIPTPDPQSSGHRCLIVRVYRPVVDAPDSNNFHAGDDPHYAWHNVTICPCSSGGGARGGARENGRNRPAGGTNSCTFDISTANVNNKAAEQVKLRVVRDPHPTLQVLDAVLPMLQSETGYGTVSDRIQPQGFSLQLPDFPNAVVRDNSRPGCLGLLFYFLTLLLGLLGIKIKFPTLATPTYEAQFEMQPGQFTRFAFATDLSSTPRGEAYVYHFTQVGSDQTVHGGLTLAMVAV